MLQLLNLDWKQHVNGPILYPFTFFTPNLAWLIIHRTLQIPRKQRVQLSISSRRQQRSLSLKLMLCRTFPMVGGRQQKEVDWKRYQSHLWHHRGLKSRVHLLLLFSEKWNKNKSKVRAFLISEQLTDKQLTLITVGKLAGKWILPAIKSFMSALLDWNTH